ncbi:MULTISPECIES: phosphogluconate dehydrogenase (NAD(+)-dependent, decarboxylating) [unclassified Rhodococcus (in: high G+C Gram-positive bacteria)]|uniref:phosphogluconate dehydrogenase (NAD(+)-dependent, decarboxylating) n=1 Tax=unclassified Rhodococcus (in: high G+C Gram-positive bacteria) TaxID=192944 RepID=UPI001639DA2E|nr:MULTISPECIES: decarboxylating 6-phosphogluconate dehydrogenase [unclassified Rhodococcus (in: high G+C Gram-positive bacteria)]MBC2637921.1 decarboxylating 6-phosphogluconate dehydrogenase [Rhodococcus sp. 3A]MBC2897331.1 decarboxylating 6-phosphogluconate dehydrogenase [Rhodococcus sp. 4CII]
MQLGLIGLGRMGGNMRERVRAAGHEVVGYDSDPSVCDVGSLAELVTRLSAPRVVWVMVPAVEPARAVINELSNLLAGGDLVIEGGNSRYSDEAHSDVLRERGIGYLDCGVSGGVWGLEEGYGLMVGGDEADVARALPIFDALRPPGDRAASFVHAGPVGAGHYAKMVHNGIEYGLMQAYAEGYELVVAEPRITTPDTVMGAWQQGTVVRSWLLELLVAALREDPGLRSISGYAADSGERRWTIEEAITHAVPVIPAALFARFSSRQADSPTMKAVSALRRQFGGHQVRTMEAVQA